MKYSELENYASEHFSHVMWIRSNETRKIIGCFSFLDDVLYYIDTFDPEMIFNAQCNLRKVQHIAGYEDLVQTVDKLYG